LNWLTSALRKQLSRPELQLRLARIAAAYGPRSLKLGNRLFVFRWYGVCEILDDSAGFLIEPVNRDRIEAVSGPFFLGMDSKPQLFSQRHAAYGALAMCRDLPITATIRSRARQLIAEAARAGQIDVVNGYARPIAAEVAALLFGIKGPSQADLMRVARAVFHETFLNLADDPEVGARGIAAGQELTAWIDAEIDSRRKTQTHKADFLGNLIALSTQNDMEDNEIGWITAGFLVGAIDTTATAVANILREVIGDPALAKAMDGALAQPAQFRAFCWEALRRRPHNPLLVRVAGEGAKFAGKPVAAGTRVFAITLTAMQDPAAFPDPRKMDPWRPADRYLHFGRGLHHCAGRDLNALQIPMLVGELVPHLAPGASEAEFDGPFPDRLDVNLKEVSP
jgi:cytochrome P450